MTDFTIHLAIFIGIWSIQALSLNLQYGLTGLVNFGQVLFFGIGAYAVAISAHAGNVVWGPFIGVVVAVLVGALISLPTRRLRPDYWALVTFGAAEIFRLVILNESALAGGAQGIGQIAPVGDAWKMLVATVAALVLSFAIVEAISRSALGRILRTIREDQLLAATLGRDVFRYQLRVVMVASAIGSISGSLYALYITYINPEILPAQETFVIWTIMILGGIGNNWGMIAGAALVEAFSVGTRFVAQASGVNLLLVSELRLMLFAVLLVAVVIYRQQGLLPERRQTYRAPD